jgi:hypothetical protein
MGQQRWTRTGLGLLALAGSTAAAWWLWLGRDTEYQTDPATGVTSGPYETWQVVGCVLSLAVLAFTAGLMLRPWIVVPTMAGAFTIAWSTVAARDETGLWLVGAILVFVGLTFGSAVVSSLAWLASTVLHRRRLGVGT